MKKYIIFILLCPIVICITSYFLWLGYTTIVNPNVIEYEISQQIVTEL